MILKISTNKTRYDKGQIFPFLIAIIVVIVIIAMITVNLGQIGIFKTDVSNAADSAALSGASILSGYLLGVGLKSDMMAGQMIVEFIAIIFDIIAGILLIIGGILSFNPVTVRKGMRALVAAIMTYISTTIDMLVTYLLTLEEGKMAWSNAKKTALQYAFQNAGIDEPRPTFKQFVKGVYYDKDTDIDKVIDTLAPETIATYNEVYFRGDDPDADTATREKIRIYTENGFSRFMRGPGGRGGYWNEKKWGQILPGHMSPPIVTSGYGWGQIMDKKGNIIDINSYDDKKSYLNYDNYVEVRVIGNVMYPLRLYNGYNIIKDLIDDFLETIEEIVNEDLWDKLEKILKAWAYLKAADCAAKCNLLLLPQAIVACKAYCLIQLGIDLTIAKNVAEAIAIAFLAYLMIMIGPFIMLWSFSPAGLRMDDIKQQTDKNYLTVTVRRHKKESDLGLWKFRYGTPGKDFVEAQAQAHAYDDSETGKEKTIEPLFWQDFFDATLLGLFRDAVKAARENKTLREVKDEEQYGWFDTRRHLFETEITNVK